MVTQTSKRPLDNTFYLTYHDPCQENYNIACFFFYEDYPVDEFKAEGVSVSTKETKTFYYS